MLGHLVFNGHIDDGAYTASNGGWLKRLWAALFHIKF
jgi:hypothetical protein